MAGKNSDHCVYIVYLAFSAAIAISQLEPFLHVGTFKCFKVIRKAFDEFPVNT